MSEMALCMGLLLQLPRTTVRVFGLGQWFVPCQAGDEECEDDVSARVAAGRTPASLAGWLHYDNSLRPFLSQKDIGAGGGILGDKVRALLQVTEAR